MSDLNINLDQVPEHYTWCPNLTEHLHMALDEEIVLSMWVNACPIQVYAWKDDWYYINTGSDGHAVLGRAMMLRVLSATIGTFVPGGMK